MDFNEASHFPDYICMYVCSLSGIWSFFETIYKLCLHVKEEASRGRRQLWDVVIVIIIDARAWVDGVPTQPTS